ncbi:MAG: peptide chain release factor 3 [Paludibacteraceae bacterium]|jgi:peptide chain release factor 3|nr:peptide chain release factor 3 [Bacteroidales bacterium]MBP3466158.1 peptide chain release factor 3 [Paludibacteraceae bacterium]MBQ3680188.1 peptide chain release factor 3 [Paludibacteraceae bacterium]MBQ3895916.1 peptide chain release factor 3 [Paludibacteraceae bacterium]MBQ6962834.1 peptide chain release factor 3 [Paludibacteraceae bacterium]
MTLQEEIKRRRTFAIISHPDAGKTTLTEKLLLFGGAIHVAGAVKSNKIKKTATSDWMEIEKQRGISVATSVMGFEYENYKINILDTPGHEDFAEDTFRTLTAVDSVIIVVDIAKGVEKQTRRLMEVCRMRNTPVIIFVNKTDRNGKNPFDLLDELEEELKIKVRPLTWPINQGDKFKGVYNIYKENLALYRPSKQVVTESVEVDINSSDLDEHIGDQDAAQLREDLELINGVYDTFDKEAYLRGELAPVFFGSALNNFGVKELLDCFVEIAPCPRPTKTEEREVKPEEPNFSGFIFKIHANMDPNHRSCIAFVKICSGKFERNVNYKHVRQGKTMKFSSPTAFMAQKKETVDEAFAGDIVGLPDSNSTFKIGDTLTSGEDLHFKGLPSFSPEMFKYIENADPMKAKQLDKGIQQLMDEGVAQLFVNQFNGRKIIGTVGQLQFEVIQYRLEHEYNALCRWEPISLYKACWIECDDKNELENFKRRKVQYMALDKQGRDVFLADSGYMLQVAQQDFPKIKFHFSSEF